MALVIEDGTGLPDAESYADVTYLRQYANVRGLEIPSNNAACEVLLVKAADAMQGLDYRGQRVNAYQALDLPRVGIVIDGILQSPERILRRARDIQCILAIEAQAVDLQPTVAPNAPGPVTSESVGDVSVSYAYTGRANDKPIITKAAGLLKPLLRGGGGLAVVRA